MSDHSFRLQLVLSAISSGARTLVDISRKSGGIYPLELKELLDELILKGDVICTQSGYELSYRRKENYPEYSHFPQISLPESHPLDYDWRFANTTSRFLTELAITENFLNNGSVLLLGAPSVFAEIIQFNPTPQTTLIDKSREFINYLKQIELPESVTAVDHDLLCGILWESERKANIVICDPPWYVEHYIAFLAQAAYSACIGAAIVVPLLPINTRPNAVEDRSEILSKAHDLGLVIQSIENARVEYKTPEFELVSLSSTGIGTCVNWRRGDLAIFRKVKNLSSEAILRIASSAYTADSEDAEWLEILLGKYKIKLRGPVDDYLTPPELVSIERDDILPTVSRRYKGREAVDMWLWDNRVFGVKGKASFWAALHILDRRSVPPTLAKVPEENLHRAVAILQKKLGDISDSSTHATRLFRV
jgi:hypothetical protein